jgi:hypothetical protein
MRNFQEKDFVNAIEYVKDGEHAGKLKLNVSTGPLFTSRDIYANVHDCKGLMALDNDGVGEEDIDSNVLMVESYTENGQLKQSVNESLVLPADGYRDESMLEWVLSVKAPHSDFTAKESLDVLFNDLMLESFEEKTSHGGISPLDKALLATGDN